MIVFTPMSEWKKVNREYFYRVVDLRSCNRERDVLKQVIFSLTESPHDYPIGPSSFRDYLGDWIANEAPLSFDVAILFRTWPKKDLVSYGFLMHTLTDEIFRYYVKRAIEFSSGHSSDPHSFLWRLDDECQKKRFTVYM